MPYHILTKYNNHKQNMEIFYKNWKKYNEIQLAKNKIDLNNKKITNHPCSPGTNLEKEKAKTALKSWIIQNEVNNSNRVHHYPS